MKHPELITAVGRALYGSTWQRQMARALKVDERTVRAWEAGRWGPSPDSLRGLLKLAKKRQAEVARVLPLLERAARGR